MASTYLTRTTGSPTLGTKCTVSVWVKISEVPGGSGSDRWLFGEYGNGSNHSYLYLRNSSEIGWYEADGSGTVASIITNRLCRDLNGWYHFMIVYDTTLSTQADRFKMYINGERQTSFSTNTNSISQDYLPRINRTGRTYHIGGVSGVQTMFNGSMSHYNHVDGSALAPTVFGSTDSTTGEWKIKTSPSVTYGDNGFFILKDGNSVTDQSGEGNNFTVAGGTLTKTEDCPSNVFATFNPLNVQTSNAPNFAAGNTDLDSAGNAALFHGSSTLGMPLNSGKFYAEFKWKSNNYAVAGVSSRARNDARENKRPGAENGSYGFELYNGAVKTNNSTIGGLSLSSLSIGDILCIAIDCENSKLYFRKNGESWMNSGDPTSGSTGTGAISLTAAGTGDNDGFWFFVIGDGDTSSSSKISANFGNGYFLTTAVSSAGTNASNNGIFEYDVPSGYTALSTKGLNL